MDNRKKQQNEHANMDTSEMTPTMPAAAAGSKETDSDSFLQSLLDKSKQSKPTRLELLNNMKRLQSQLQKSLHLRFNQRAQLVKDKHHFDKTEDDIARLRAEMQNLGNEFGSASDW